MSAVDTAVAELDAHLAAIAPTHEGLRDFDRLNVVSATRDVVRRALVAYDRRVEQLKTARAALVALQADGYPTLVVPEITAAILADLQANADSISAALATFHLAPQAVALGLQSSPAEAK